MQTSRSSLADVSACLALGGWTGSGGGWRPTHSSACRGHTLTGTDIHGSQGTGTQPTYKTTATLCICDVNLSLQ